MYLAGEIARSGKAPSDAEIVAGMELFADALAATAGLRLERREVQAAGTAGQLRAEFEGGRVMLVRVVRGPAGDLVFAATLNKRRAASSPTDGGRFLESLRPRI